MLYYSTMQEAFTELNFSVARTIDAIPPQAWDRLFGPSLIESYGYLKTLEDDGTREFSFAYLLGKRNAELVLILPCFIMDFSFSMLIPKSLHKIIRPFCRYLRTKVLFLGSPTTEGFSMGLSPDEDPELILDGAMKELRSFCAREGAAGMLFYNLTQTHGELAAYLKRKNFFRMGSLPTTAIPIKAGSLEEYIGGLGKNTRKDLKKKLRRSRELIALKTEERADITDIIDRVYGLYLNNFNDSDVHFETLTKKFFLNICRNMPGVAKYFITYAGERIVAFNLCLVKDGVFIDKFIGFDYSVAHSYHLYQTTFCHNMDWCIRKGLRIYQPGFSDYHPKIRLGAKLLPLDIYAKAFNPCLHSFLKIVR
ncbi:MAG: GNAT family N-acetyltransferase, partial [Candidatus Omnitrophota bacterium]